MATEKILNTRIQLKYDTLSNWNASTFNLKRGEIAIAEVPTAEGTTLQPVIGLALKLLTYMAGLRSLKLNVKHISPNT